MKPLKSNTGIVAVVINNVTVQNGCTTLDTTQITSWYNQQDQQQTREHKMQLFAMSEWNIPTGDVQLFKVAYKTMKCAGHNGSEFTHTYYEIIDHMGTLPAASLQQTGCPSLCHFVLGGNVGSVEQKNANSNTWYNVSVALTRSFKDNEGNWQDDTHWARLSISQKTWDMNFKNGLEKGDSILVECDLSTNDYKDRAGNDVTGHEFRVNRVLGQVHKFELQAIKQSNQQPAQGGMQQQPVNGGMQQQPAQQSGPAMAQPASQSAQQNNSFKQTPFRPNR